MPGYVLFHYCGMIKYRQVAAISDCTWSANQHGRLTI